MTNTNKLCKWLAVSLLLLLVMLTPLGNWLFGALFMIALVMTIKYMIF